MRHERNAQTAAGVGRRQQPHGRNRGGVVLSGGNGGRPGGIGLGPIARLHVVIICLTVEQADESMEKAPGRTHLDQGRGEIGRGGAFHVILRGFAHAIPVDHVFGTRGEGRFGDNGGRKQSRADVELDIVVDHRRRPAAVRGMEALLGQQDAAIVGRLGQDRQTIAKPLNLRVDTHSGRPNVRVVGRIGSQARDGGGLHRLVAGPRRPLPIPEQDVVAAVQGEVQLGVAVRVGQEEVEKQVGLEDVGGIVLVGFVISIVAVARAGRHFPPASRVSDALVGGVVPLGPPGSCRLAHELELVGEVRLEVDRREMPGEGWLTRLVGHRDNDVIIIIGVCVDVGLGVTVLVKIGPSVDKGRRGCHWPGFHECRDRALIPGRPGRESRESDDQEQSQTQGCRNRQALHDSLL